MNLTEQLKRDGNLLKKEPRPLKPKKPLPKRSKKREIEDRIYAKKRKAYLTRGRCEAGIFGICTGRMTEIHHAQGRGKNLNNVNTWVGVCRPCHNFIHRNPKAAREMGLLQ